MPSQTFLYFYTVSRLPGRRQAFLADAGARSGLAVHSTSIECRMHTLASPSRRALCVCERESKAAAFRQPRLAKDLHTCTQHMLYYIYNSCSRNAPRLQQEAASQGRVVEG